MPCSRRPLRVSVTAWIFPSYQDQTEISPATQQLLVSHRTLAFTQDFTHCKQLSYEISEFTLHSHLVKEILTLAWTIFKIFTTCYIKGTNQFELTLALCTQCGHSKAFMVAQQRLEGCANKQKNATNCWQHRKLGEAWTGSLLESSGSCPCDIGIPLFPLFSKVCFIRAGALGRPRGMGWRGRREGESGWGTRVNPWLIHVNVWQKITTIL